MGILGGIIGPIVALAEVTAQLNSGSNPASFIDFISINPRPEASAIAEPVIPEKITEANTLTCPNPPLSEPTILLAKLKRRTVIIPSFIILAAKINNGTASKTNFFSKPITILSTITAGLISAKIT
jgi:hypothetical protein